MSPRSLGRLANICQTCWNHHLDLRNLQNQITFNQNSSLHFMTLLSNSLPIPQFYPSWNYQNKPSQKGNGSSSNHPLSGAKMLVSGRVTPKNPPRNNKNHPPQKNLDPPVRPPTPTTFDSRTPKQRRNVGSKAATRWSGRRRRTSLAPWRNPMIWEVLKDIPLMAVSKHRGTPKSSISIGFSNVNHPFWGTPSFGNPGGNMTPERWWQFNFFLEFSPLWRENEGRLFERETL